MLTDSIEDIRLKPVKKILEYRECNNNNDVFLLNEKLILMK